MKKIAFTLFALVMVFGFYNSKATSADLTITTGGRIAVELITSYAAYHNTLSLVSPANAAIVLNGCLIEGTNAPNLKLLSEKTSQHGCRVELDADSATPGIQPFNVNDVLEFNLCAQADANPATCEFNWSSNPNNNDDNKDHVKTTELHSTDPDVSGRIFLLTWEDQNNLGDNDFNDLIVVVRVIQDTDEDGLWDDWEKFGIDTTGNGTADFVIPGADPQHKDIYVEIDYMDCTVAGGDCAATDIHSHEPKQDAIDEVVQAFADAPVPNPDGFDGITLHIDVDDAIAHSDTLNMGCFTGTRNFDTIKSDPNFFGPNNPRRFVYHYVIFGHQQIATDDSSGCGEVDGNDFIVTLGAWNYECTGGTRNGLGCRIWLGNVDCPNGGTCQAEGDVDGDGDDDHDVGTDRQQAGTLMHELGHNLNLQHGGGDCINYKPNYLSIMSYRFQFSGILPGGRLDYSAEELDDLNEDNNNLDETDGIGNGTDDTRYNCPNGTVRNGAGNLPIDWNCDNDNGADNAVTVNINGDCTDTVSVNCGACDVGEPDNALDTLTGYDDWENLKYDFQNNSNNFDDGVHAQLDIPDMNYQHYRLMINNPPVANAGQDETFECTGSNGASVTLDGSGSDDPDGDPLTFSWTGIFGTQTGEMPSVFLPLGTHTILLTVEDNKGGSASDSVIITVLDTTPPELDVTLSPDLLWPPDHKLKGITAIINATDICDSDPEIQLLSVTSNEPDEGLGDGDFPKDIQDADFGTEDLAFFLRRERSGMGNGRIYTTTYSATDDSGNTTEVDEIVLVPHNE